MSTSDRPSDSRLLSGGILAILGRIVIVVASGVGLVSLTLHSELIFLRPVYGLAVGILISLIAAYLVRDFKWLLYIPAYSIAGGTLFLGAALGKQFLIRESHYLTPYEMRILVACFLGLALSVLWLRHGRKKAKKARKRG